jgi:glycosyltransferase involved in cell wall biosynthesis
VLRSDPPDVLLATGPPFNSFVAARHLADAFCVPLILDYRDEWTEGTPGFVRAGPRDRAIEAACLARADRVIFVTESVQRLYLNAFPLLQAARCLTIRNGWDPQDVSAAEALHGAGAGSGGGPVEDAGAGSGVPAPEDPGAQPGDGAGFDRPTILHAGSLGAHNTPGVFLEQVARILVRREDLRRSLRIRFIGRGSGEVPAQLAAFPHSDLLEVVAHILPKPATLLEMRRAAAVLLLNGPKRERAIPGKFYEYVAMGTPVLVHGDAGEVPRIVRELGAGWVVPVGDDAALEAALEHVAARTVRSGDPARIAAWLDDHTREAMSRRFYAVADEVRRASR